MADESNSNASLNSMEFYSMHVESLRRALETLDVNDEHAKFKVEIELSKVHWSELASPYYTATEGSTMASSSTSLSNWVNEEGTPEWKLEVAKDNVVVFRSLQEKYLGGFFIDEKNPRLDFTQRLPQWMIDDDDTSQTWGFAYLRFGFSSETPFVEGGQAKLFHAHLIDDDEREEFAVLKVFKDGMPLRDLLKLFSTTMLTNDITCMEGSFTHNNSNFNPILGTRLLKHTGRFAFLMVRAWGDLQKLINERMLHFNIQGAPFPDDVALYILYGIAKGMMEFHERDIIHRYLKVANVLVFGEFLEDSPSLFCKFDSIHLHPTKFNCMVANFECLVGIVGTGFWRALEILEAVKNQNIFQKPELFTKQADVYSFGLTCYEVMSGGLPLEGLRANDYDGVIRGVRPTLPSQTLLWMVDLVNRCWHKDPSMRPPFKEIMKVLEPHVPKEEVEEEDP